MQENNDEAILNKMARLREPFQPHQISKLPKPTKSDAPKGKCPECGGYHGLPAIHLDYVGHAALTDRLLEVDPFWSWEPLALTPEGLPLIDKEGGMWVKLTICGITRLGYGDAQGKTGNNATKERIGDALRNAGMRFGLALDLWHKGELHVDDDGNASSQKPAPIGAKQTVAQTASNSGGGTTPKVVDKPSGRAITEPERAILNNLRSELGMLPITEAMTYDEWLIAGKALRATTKGGSK